MKNPIDKLTKDFKQMCGIDLLNSPTTKSIVENAKTYQKNYTIIIAATIGGQMYNAGKRFAKK